MPMPCRPEARAPAGERKAATASSMVGGVKHESWRRGIDQIVPVGFFGNRLAVQQADDDIQALVHHAARVSSVDAHLHRVVDEGAGADAKHGPTTGNVVEQNHPIGGNERIVVR
jgi:hypothetical protein